MEPIMLGVIILMLGFIYKDLEEIKILIKEAERRADENALGR